MTDLNLSLSGMSKYELILVSRFRLITDRDDSRIQIHAGGSILEKIKPRFQNWLSFKERWEKLILS